MGVEMGVKMGVKRYALDDSCSASGLGVYNH